MVQQLAAAIIVRFHEHDEWQLRVMQLRISMSVPYACRILWAMDNPTVLPPTIHPSPARDRVSVDSDHFRHTNNRICNTGTLDSRAPIRCIDLGRRELHWLEALYPPTSCILIHVRF
ncbi:unnamed protein product [Sphagnum balticum]